MGKARSLGWVALWAAACTVPALPPIDTDTDGETDPDAVETDTDTDIGESDTVDPFETGWFIDTDEPTFDTDIGVPLGCHPYDPVSSATGWTRRYRYQLRGSPNGVEVQTGLGYVTKPNWAGGGEAWGYEVRVTNAGSANGTGTYWHDCSGTMPDDGLYEQGWIRSTPSLAGQISLRADARSPRRILPPENRLTSLPSYPNETTRYDLTQVGTPFPSAAAQLVRRSTLVVWPQESVTVPAGTFASAVKVIETYTEEKQASGGIMDAFFGIFDSMFGALFGYSSGATSIDAEATRWYVRGIGLVKEEVIDVAGGGTTISVKELRNCSGLPGCP